MLSTSPNAALPIGYRKKIAGDLGRDATGGTAAGILFVAPDGDVLVLRRSSAEQNYAGHWALPGGGAEEGETPEQAAARESREEMGIDVEGGMRPLDRRVTPNGKVFHTFAHRVPEKFVPKLNGEHSGYAWAPLDQLPGPLHPAVQQTLQEQLGMGGDMAPEDWSGLRDGFLKWTAEEEAEPEHAEDDDLRDGKIGEGSAIKLERQVKDVAERAALDSSLRLALDRDSVRSFDEDGRMRVATANISKACVNPYRGAEIPNAEELGLDPRKVYMLLRDPKELEAAASTFNGIQVLQRHIPVSAEDSQKWDIVGTTGTDSKFEHPYLKNSLHFWDKSAIDDVHAERKKELSCGYHYKADMTPGNFDGMPYDGVMRDIRGNHVALVKDGRAGPDVVVGDSMENLMSAKPTRLAALTLGLTAAAVAPLLARDAKLELPKDLFAPITSKNFKGSKDKLLAGVRMALDGKLRTGLAVDASTEHVKTVLDALEGMAEGIDASVSEEQHGAMEAAAHGESNLGIPKSVGQEFVSKDNAGAEGLGAFLKSKGMGDADIKTACDMFPKAATDEDPEEKKKREEEAAKKSAEDAAALAAKDAEMKDMVKKPAMDEAIKTAVATARAEEQAIRVALDKVRPYVGEIAATMALDTAEAVYRHAAVALNIKDAKTIHASALPTLIEMQPKVGARPVEREARLGMDEATMSEAAKIAPGIANIHVGV